ncbi:MAG: PAS domain S-box protein [Anaerolineales bacterium]|nr:PAS domain S-box protein [Anaerolineales bacterium]
MDLIPKFTSLSARIVRYFSPPANFEPEEARKAGNLQYFLILTLLITMFSGFLLARISPQPGISTALVCVVILTIVINIILVRAGRITLAGYLFPYSIWFLIALTTFVVYGSVSNPLVNAFVLVILAAGIMLGWRHGLALAFLSLLTIFTLGLVEAGTIPNSEGITNIVRNVVYAFGIYILTAGLVHITTRRIRTALERAEKNERELEARNNQLEEMRKTLEVRVNKRTQEITRQKNFLQTLVDISPIAIVSLDLDSRISSWNPAFEQMFGYAPEELAGCLLDELITDEVTVREAGSLTRQVASGSGIRELGVRYRKDGQPLQVEIFGVPVIVEGEQTGSLGLYNDISERVRTEAALRESEIQNRALFTNIAEPVLIFDQETEYFLDANPAAIKQYGYSKEEFLQMTPFDLHPREEFDRVRENIDDREGSSPNVYTHITRSGERLVVEVRTVELYYQGRPAWISFIQDISERVEAERALRDSEGKLRSIIEQSYDSILMTDEDGVITVWNQAQENLTGLKADDVLGQPLWEVEKFISLIMDAAGGGNGEGRVQVMDLLKSGHKTPLGEMHEWEVIKPDGSRRYAQSVLFPVETDTGYIAGAITRDITERKQIEQRFEYLATHDWLTNLPNRSLFHDRLEHALMLARRENTQVAVLFLDLDGFKSINDRFGHARGDELLREVAGRLRSCLRGSDTVARLGGDEFTFILENIADRESIATVVDKLYDCLSKDFLVEGSSFGISGSIGVSLFPKDAETPETLLKLADQAMYAAKQEGKNRYRFYS